MGVGHEPYLVLNERPVHEDGARVLLLAQQLELQARLAMRVVLHVRDEALVGGPVLEHQQLEDVHDAQHRLRVVRPISG